MNDGEPGDGHVCETAGRIDLYTATGDQPTSVDVQGADGGVELALANEGGAMDVLLLPEDVEALQDELDEALEQINDDEDVLEETREWVETKFREE